MRKLGLFWTVLAFCCQQAFAQSYKPQGTTVAKEKCDVYITIQIAVQTDSAGDITMLQQALDECFSIVCDLPCEDMTAGACHVYSKVVVLSYSDLSADDVKKFHYVQMRAGEGISYVDELVAPNSGRSSGGTWYRQEYSPRVYCHEVLHLCGLPDRYRDCRPDRIALGVDNCKDGDTCTAEQKAKGACPPCKGYEDDCMDGDVTKALGCNNNIMEIVRQVNDFTLACTEECCKDSTRTRTSRSTSVGLYGEIGVGRYAWRNKDFKDDKFNAYGLNWSVGVYGSTDLTKDVKLDATLKLGMGTYGNKETVDDGFYQQEQNVDFRFGTLSLGTNARYGICEKTFLHAGPEFGFLLCARERSWGSFTFGGMTTPFGSKSFEKINEKRNIQLGLNVGASHELQLFHRDTRIGINAYVPFTNQMAFPDVRNKLPRLNLFAYVPLNSDGFRF